MLLSGTQYKPRHTTALRDSTVPGDCGQAADWRSSFHFAANVFFSGRRRDYELRDAYRIIYNFSVDVILVVCLILPHNPGKSAVFAAVFPSDR